MINFDYVRASTEKGAYNLIAKNAKAKFIAGGTNLMDLMKRGVETPENLVDISRLPLMQIEQKEKTIQIGALVSNSALAKHKLITEKFPLLSYALNAGASPQLRNMATVGGNMMQRTRCPYFYDISLPCNKRQPGTGCSAIGGYNRMHAIFGASADCIAVHPSDMCIALAALDAAVVIGSTKGERKINFTDFHRLPGSNPEQDNILQKNEMIVGVELEDPGTERQKSSYVKVRDRNSYAFALVSVGVVLNMSGNTIQNARIAMGGVAHKPWRPTAAEQFLNGKSANTDNFRKAASLAMAGAKAYGHNDFKLKLAPNTIVEALEKALKNG